MSRICLGCGGSGFVLVEGESFDECIERCEECDGEPFVLPETLSIAQLLERGEDDARS